MSAAAEHLPLDGARHAAIVAELTRNAPTAWRVLFQPTDYLFDHGTDPCIAKPGNPKAPKCFCGRCTVADMKQLRVAFMRTEDWETANEIIDSLIEKDDRACKMSIGIRMDGRVIHGESV